MNTKDTVRRLLKITLILFLAIIFVYLVQYAYAKFVISSNKNVTLNFYEYRIQTSEIKIEPEGYTGGNVTVTITGSETNLQIEYQIGEQGEWNTYTVPFEIEENTTINARYVTDGFEGPVTSKIIENMVVAKIENKTYATLQEAVTASTNNTQTEIIMLADTDEKVTIPATKNIVLNTNGKTITSDGKTIVNNGTLKLTGEGIVTGYGAYVSSAFRNNVTIENYGDFQLDGATINSEAGMGIINETSGTVEITSGKVTPYRHCIYNLGTANTKEKPAIKIAGGELENRQNTQGIFHNGTGLVYMTGGKIKAQNHGIRNSVAGAKTIVEGGIIISVGETGITNMVAGGTIEVRGGIIIGRATGVGCGATGEIYIYGGTIIGEIGDGLTATVSTSYYYGGTLIAPKGGSVRGTLAGKLDGYEIQKVYGTIAESIDAKIYNEISAEVDDKTKTYEIATLVIGNYKNVTSGVFYESLHLATANSATGSTINVINNKTETVQSIIEKEKTLTINLNDKTITLTNTDIFNKGKLTVTGGENGKITSTKRVITNGSNGIDTPEKNTTAEFIKEGACTLEGTGTGSSTIVNYAIATVKSGNVDSKVYRALYNAGRATIEGGKLTGKDYSVYNSGTENTCLETNPSENPALKITGGEIYSNGNVSLYNDSEGEVYITGGTISQGVGNSVIYNKKTGIIHLAGATINHSATGGSGIANASTGKIIVTSGTITSSKTIGIENLSTGTITIGTNETTPSVSTTVPSITGATKGVNNPSGKLYYYDGVIKATNGTAISGTVTGKPTGYDVKTTTSGTAQTSILASATSTSSTSSTFSLRPSASQQEQTEGESQTEQGEELEQTEGESQTEQEEQPEESEQTEEIIDVQVEEEKNVQIGTNTYETINKAIESANNGDTIKILENIEITEKVEIPKNKEIKIDLNNKTITSNLVNTIENKGTLTITSMGIIRNEVDNGTVILNNGTLNIENGIITNATNGGKGIYNEGTVNISGGKIVTEGIGTNCIYNAKNSKLNMNGGIIETIGFGSKGIYNNSEVEILKNEDEEIIPNIVVSADDCIGIYNSEDATVCNIMSAEITIEAEEIENYEEIKNADEFKAELEEMKSSYGIYNNAEIDVNLEEVVIKVERLKGIGIYNNSAGSIVLGKLDDVVNVATPIIYAIADNTTAIVNVDTESGKIKFYDGTLSTLVSIKALITDVLENYELFENIGENVINTILKEIEKEEEKVDIGDVANWQ